MVLFTNTIKFMHENVKFVTNTDIRLNMLFTNRFVNCENPLMVAQLIWWCFRRFIDNAIDLMWNTCFIEFIYRILHPSTLTIHICTAWTFWYGFLLQIYFDDWKIKGSNDFLAMLLLRVLHQMKVCSWFLVIWLRTKWLW